jgi:hypothetical protein
MKLSKLFLFLRVLNLAEILDWKEKYILINIWEILVIQTMY